jgi:hypothetical protein
MKIEHENLSESLHYYFQCTMDSENNEESIALEAILRDHSR